MKPFPSANNFHKVNDAIGRRSQRQPTNFDRSGFGYNVDRTSSLIQDYGNTASLNDKRPKTPAEEQSDLRFVRMMRELMQEHQQQINALRDDNDLLTSKVNTVLTATWEKSNEAWVGHPNTPDKEPLVLMTEGYKDATWMVPEEFVNDYLDDNTDPDTFGLRDEWKNLDTDADGAKNTLERRNSLKGFDIVDEEASEASEESNIERSNNACGRRIIHPTSSKRLCWDIAGMVLLMYDVVMVPILVFDPVVDTFALTMDWTTLIYWTFDVVASCITGYVAKGETVLKPKKILKNYAKTWMGLDAIIILPDWIFTILEIVSGDSGETGGESTSATKLLRSLRMVRALRLLRLAKLKRFLVLIKDNIQSEMVFKAVNILQIVILLVFANHFLASLWYFVGKESTGKNWWSLSSYTLGTINSVEPQNDMERIFAIFMLIAGMCFFCVFTSHITLAIFQARENKLEVSTQMWFLRRYLRQENVPVLLTYRVLRYAEYAVGAQKERLKEDKVAILDYLSEGLRTEVRFEANFAELSLHPLFETALTTSMKTIHTLANGALSRKRLASKDKLFKRGTWADHMFMVCSGTLLYALPGGGGGLRALSVGDWLCESVLWVKWMTRGVAKSGAKADCELILVDWKAFSKVLRADDELWTQISTYAANYKDWLNTLDVVRLSDVSIAEQSRPKVRQLLAQEREEVEVIQKDSRKTAVSVIASSRRSTNGHR